jgi:hypothetical protein
MTVGNNISDALTLAPTDPPAPVKVLTAAVADMASMIPRPYAPGARHISIVNSTNVGRTPYAQSLGSAAVAAATQLSAQFNGALARQIAGLKATSPGLNVYPANAFAFTEQAVANPAAFPLCISPQDHLHTGHTFRMAWLDRIPLWILIAVALTLGLAPFVPEPHVWEKLKMLAAGTLARPIDIFDLLYHAAPWVLLALKLVRMAQRRG